MVGVVEQVSGIAVILDGNVQIRTRRMETGVPRSELYFGQRAASGQGVADKRVSSVVDCERSQALQAV